MSSEARAAIPRPSICRQVIVSRRDGGRFSIGGEKQTPYLVPEAPATVVAVDRDEDLAICVLLGADWYRAPHADLAAVNYPGDLLVWRWPART